MEFDVKSGSPAKQRSACVVVAVFEPRKLSAAAIDIDEVSGGYLAGILRRGDIEGKVGQTLLLHSVPNILADRVLLIGCGKERDLNDSTYRKVIGKMVSTLQDTGSMEAVCFLPELSVGKRDAHWKIKQAVETASETLYNFDQLKSKKDAARRPLRKLVFNVTTRKELTESARAIEEALSIAEGVKLTRDLANLPPNICHPTYLAQKAQEIAKANKSIKTTIIDQAELKKMGAGAFVAVAQGSDQPGKLIVMEYNGGKSGTAPIVLVGKGITFDTGGISIKPSEAMDEMKYDMGGAASVFGTMTALAKLGLPINVIGVVAAAENMPSGKATRPGDIVTTLSGQTVEILNTDAEGRLVLCDALTYVERFDPDTVIDIATLTGACIIALGHQVSGMLSNHNPLANELFDAGESSGDRVWRLPLYDEYHEQLESPFADFSNLGGRPAGTITAAAFLSKFAKKFHWAHLDVAGTAWKSGKAKGATGRPVPLLMQFLIDRAGKQKRK
ncbi:leucyl aminopeptidase [Permianibacter aggregans]|uniref:Probable cytosol aminopeptidase n=1 Tax=Permianibacter aggregans TaxID=1510150 RepID=A0A4R6UYL4_9GAMM|nr:leucyl aminopeptidase [Permianibacter aggregans]QGX41380.1 leucyl aminopeptidase [Permianibacter aggregans]TDQ51169.1 aminopeptidase A [Permianibacter aggregans]